MPWYLKKGILHYFQTVYLQVGTLKKSSDIIQGGKIHVRAFPEAKSTQLNNYVKPTQDQHSYDAAIMHLGVNDILWSKDYDDLDKLPGNIIKVANTCQKYNIGKMYMSAILPSTRTNIFKYFWH